LRTADGRTIWVRDYAIPVRERGTGRVFQIYGVVRDITQRKLDEEQLRRLASELAKTEEVERRRMATFLHDTVSQSLILAKRTLEGARSAPPAETDAAIRTVMGHLQESIDNARALTVDLCPPILYDLGLGPAIDWLSERMEEAHGIRVEFSDDGRPKPLAPEVRTILYAGARELLVNIVKHAHARQVWIDLRRDGGEVVLAVEDDGVGFGAATRGDGSGFGLTNVRERMRHLGGKLEIEANKAGGARVTLSAPALTTPEGTS
jgi:signal transduction histidine kinase